MIAATAFQVHPGPPGNASGGCWRSGTSSTRLPQDRAVRATSAFCRAQAVLAEYHSLRDRRFHAEPNACPTCGPRLAFLDGHGEPVADIDVVAEAIARLRAATPSPSKDWRIPSRRRCAQCRERRPLARKEGARGKAVRRDGRQRSVGGSVDGDRNRRAEAARSPRARHRPAREAPRGRSPAGRGRAGPCVAWRDAALCAAALPAVSRGGGTTGRHRMAGSRTGARIGDDKRQSGRRTAGDGERRGRRATCRHCRRVPRSPPRHRRRLRRQRAASPSGEGADATPVLSAARAVTRHAPSGSPPPGLRSSRWAGTSRTRCA